MDFETTEILNTTMAYDIPPVVYWEEIYMIIVFWVVFIPILAYFAREYYRHRNTMFIQKRKGVIMQVHLSITLTYLVFILPLFVGVADAFAVSMNADGWDFWIHTGLYTYYIGTEFFVYAIFYSLIWRAMMMWWEYNEQQALKNDEWMHYLSSGSDDAKIDKLSSLRMESVVSVSSQDVPAEVNVTAFPEQSPGPAPAVRSVEYAWVFRYKKTLGNQWWVFRRLACCYAVVSGTLYFTYVCAADSYGAYWNTDLWSYKEIFKLDLSLALFHMFIVVCFWMATPPFYDPFKIRNEMRYMTMAAFIIPIISWIWTPLYEKVDVQIAESIIVAIQFTTMFCLLMSSVGYSVIKGKSLGFLTLERQSSQTGELDPLSGEIVPPANSPKGTARKIRLHHVLAERKMLDLFAQHLVSEFSVECLLAVIEFCQFKLKLQDDKDFMSQLYAEKNERAEEVPMPKLPFKKLPQSQIVHGAVAVPEEWRTAENPIVNEYKMRALNLYERYVDPSTAELEINISYQERKHLAGVFDKERYWKKDGMSCEKMMTIWDISIRSMIHLMGDSYGRFTRSPQFTHVTKHFSNTKDGARASLSMSIKNMKTALAGVAPLETELISDER